MAVKVGGTTLRDYVGADGNPGYFRQKLYVYERAGKAVPGLRQPDQAIHAGTTFNLLVCALPEVSARSARMRA